VELEQEAQLGQLQEVTAFSAQSHRLAAVLAATTIEQA
jgi:hypothetical protein